MTVNPMPIYQTTFEINATADRVWSVLTNLERYAEWNPQIPRISGALKKGSQISLRLALPDKSPMEHFQQPLKKRSPLHC